MIDLSNYKDYLSEKAHRVLTSAIEESQKRQHYYLGVEHIFLAIVEIEPGLFADLAGKLNLDEELALMSRLDLMIAMDSSNMHMAALTGTKVISIWGGTDPLSGFSAWMQPDNLSIRIPVDELTCRPCTIYGKGTTRNGFACMKMLTPELVFNRIEKLVLSGFSK